MIRPLAKSLALLLFAGLTLAPGEARAEVLAAPTRWVTDSADFLSEGARQEFDSRLETYERQAGHQVLVWIDRTTGIVPLEDFTVQSFRAWRVGRKGLDDGLVLFVFADDRKLRVEVGYGLEGQVPDAIASRIIQETIVPRIQAGDRDGAIRAGIAALITAIEGKGAAPDSTSGAPDRTLPEGGVGSLTLRQMVLLGLGVIAFLILFATNPALAVYLLVSVLSGGRGGGRGGGGYSGGGGRSGGGGASGSW